MRGQIKSFSGAAEFTTFLQATLSAGSRSGRGAERDDELLRCRRSADAAWTGLWKYKGHDGAVFARSFASR
jgi:hypothetical protein